jgi:hypothetical protein
MVYAKGRETKQEEEGHREDYKSSTRLAVLKARSLKKRDGNEGSRASFYIKQVGKVSHRIKQGLKANDEVGRAWEHEKH